MKASGFRPLSVITIGIEVARIRWLALLNAFFRSKAAKTSPFHVDDLCTKSYPRLNLRLFPTTDTELSAIAAAASMGFKRNPKEG